MGSPFLSPVVTPEGASLDIVAVHGLNPFSKENHAYDTWTANGKLWLRDFLPVELSHARILIFGYNANAVFENSTAGVTDIAGSLLNLLVLRRDHCQTRPIIFIAHSLGGIIVKKALVDAQANVAYQSLDEATLGIVFFGTPHNGSDHADLGNIAASIASSLLRSPTNSLIDSLRRNSLFADELRKQFRQKLMHYWVLSCYETLPSGTIGVIVDEKSAVLGLPGPDETPISLNSNHSEICRFSSREDDAYFQVSQNIVMLAKKAPKRYSHQKESITRQGETGKGKEPKRLNTMPTDNANSPFTGREKILEQLRHSLPFSNDEHARTALWGLAGSGKTRIAREFARRLQTEMPEIHVFWVYAATEARVRQSYADIAAVANVQPPQDRRSTGHYTVLPDLGNIDNTWQPQTDIVQLVHSWLQSKESGRWLVIVDSADNHSSLRKAFAAGQDLKDLATPGKESLAHMLPRSPMGAILITTRNKKLALDLTDNHNPWEVPRMDDVEAAKLVNNKLEALVPKQVEVHSLVTLLNWLPLALVQAAAYIHKTSITINKYIDLYKKDEITQMRLLGQGFSDLERDQNAENAVSKTWILSFEQIKLEHPQAAYLLSTMSFFDAQNIPESLLQVIIPDSLDLVESLATLKAFALVTSSEDNETYDMHRMAQSSMQRWLEACQESTSWANRAIETLDTVYGGLSPDMWHETLDTYYPHTIAALASDPGTTKESLEGRASLWQMAGVTLRSNFQEVKAHVAFTKAIQLRTDVLGDSHSRTLTAILIAGANLCYLARQDTCYMQEAEELLLKAIQGLEIAADPEAEETLTAKILLAELYTKSKEWTKAKEILTLILTPNEDNSERPEKEIRVIMHAKRAMAHLCLLEGTGPAAEKMQLEVVSYYERTFTRENDATQAAISGLASIYSALGQVDKARDLYEEIISTKRRLRGEAHPTTTQATLDLAEVYCKLERYEESLGLLKELMPLKREDLAYDDELQVHIIEQIADSLHHLCRYDEEIISRKEALAMRRQLHGFDHVNTVHSAAQMITCCHRLQRYGEVVVLLVEVVSAMKRMLGDEHEITLSTMLRLAVICTELGEFQAGMSLGLDVFNARKRLLGDDHVDTRAVCNVIDACASRLGWK